MKPRARELGRSGLGETETRRIRRSLFATSATTHAEALEETAKAFGKQCAVSFQRVHEGAYALSLPVIEEEIRYVVVAGCSIYLTSASSRVGGGDRRQLGRFRGQRDGEDSRILQRGLRCLREASKAESSIIDQKLQHMVKTCLFSASDSVHAAYSLPEAGEGSTVRIKAESFVEHVWQNEVNAEIDELGCFWVEVARKTGRKRSCAHSSRAGAMSSGNRTSP
eukprot:765838-Hanusia_phi.AAC.4